MFEPEIIEDRFGNKVFRCPLCGHVFYKHKQYQRHLMKSHLLGGFKRKRLWKKFLKHVEKVKEKLQKGEQLTRFEYRVYLRAKMLKLL